MDIIKKMADRHPENRIALKVLEEASELIEVIIKRETKAKDLRPPDSKLIEEIGDLKLRLDILIYKMGISEEVYQRYKDKSEQLDRWYTKEYETIK